ncbi:MAG: type I methionyl aminopeptidase [Kofleriaceae bacterium]|nr:type I methionyl aminopeptidase [Kofleriaceae bacterium]MCL4223478.1 type I methionyl aminopeptidase [Myxococcales bacterium]
MKIVYKSLDEIRLMRESALVVAAILDEVCQAVVPGISTWELDRIARAAIKREGVTSAFLGYAQPPYPAVTCISVNEEIVHGIPRRDKVIAEGDLVSVDFGSFKHGMCADSARTVIAGQGTAEGRRLVDATRRALDLAIAQCRVDNRLEDIGSAVQTCAEGEGYSVVRVFVGHGIGKRMHEDPPVHNYGTPGRGKRIKRGLVIAVEPMVNAGSPEVEVLDDGWTAVTKDRSLSAHFEHTIAVLDDGPWVLTRPSSSPGVPGHD